MYPYSLSSQWRRPSESAPERAAPLPPPNAEICGKEETQEGCTSTCRSFSVNKWGACEREKRERRGWNASYVTHHFGQPVKGIDSFFTKHKKAKVQQRRMKCLLLFLFEGQKARTSKSPSKYRAVLYSVLYSSQLLFLLLLLLLLLLLGFLACNPSTHWFGPLIQSLISEDLWFRVIQSDSEDLCRALCFFPKIRY